MKIFILDYCILPLFGFFVVKYLTNLDFDFDYKLYENNFIMIDYWFFIHIINTKLMVLIYPYKLSTIKFWYIVFGWEVIENFFIPNLSKDLYYFKEDIRDSFGDIIAAIPAYILFKKINN